ncbi:kinase-like protein [Gonapodya prolifera JEL478]|uniref:Kinase-like protein n=1 Tax=Gonapodya prolifera (strain JEL478) TaxID=1344416 RepID=A0A139AEZ8_GONPJ|nr:kinase-like protein [Gonapodya prolifera JEL478]|eukprot:KXS15357.1 kinase-like protein [Gonapodya prolifera JEL478]
MSLFAKVFSPSQAQAQPSQQSTLPRSPSLTLSRAAPALPTTTPVTATQQPAAPSPSSETPTSPQPPPAIHPDTFAPDTAHDHGAHSSNVVFGRIPHAPEPDASPPGAKNLVLSIFGVGKDRDKHRSTAPSKSDAATTPALSPPSKPPHQSTSRGGALPRTPSSSLSPSATAASSASSLTDAEYHARLAVISWPASQILRYKYTLVDNATIGRGAEGTVKLVRPISNPEELYCVKTFHRKSGDLRAYVEKCVREHELTRQLEGHENVIRTVDLVLDDATWQVVEVLEYCRDGTLSSVLRRGRFQNQAEIDCIFIQILYCLAFMHAQGVAHNDWKVENIVWEPAHKLIKVIDFGLSFRFAPSPPSSPTPSAPPAPTPAPTPAPAPATATETEPTTAPTAPPPTEPKEAEAPKETPKEAPKPTMRTSLVGSKMYMAPEQWSGKPWDPRAVDIWMVAIVYIHLSTRGKFPWPAAAMSEPAFAKWSKKGEFDKEIATRLPAASLPLLRAMLNPDPTKRPSASDLLNDPWLAQVPVCARRAAREAGYEVERDGYLGKWGGGTPVGGLLATAVGGAGAGEVGLAESPSGSPAQEAVLRESSIGGGGGMVGAAATEELDEGQEEGSKPNPRPKPRVNPNTGQEARRVPTVVMFHHEHRYS